MGIASFSPSLPMSQPLSTSQFESSGWWLALAPMRAIAALLIPAQSARNSHAVYRHAPATPLANEVTRDVMNNMARASVVAQNFPVAVANEIKAPCINRLKVMREFDPGLKRTQVGRMAISGRMSDVCDELDRIALKAAANL